MSGHEIARLAVAQLLATDPLELVSFGFAIVYCILAIRRSRWCWIAGGVSSALLIYLAFQRRLPMQAALQVYYVVISAYGWLHWTREKQEQGVLVVSTWHWRQHAQWCAAVLAVSWVNALWLGEHTQAAWPFLDSLTSWGSLLATWLQTRIKLENWLYWIVFDSLLAVLFGAQGLYFIALLSVVYVGFSTVGFVRWLKTYRTPLPAS